LTRALQESMRLDFIKISKRVTK